MTNKPKRRRKGKPMPPMQQTTAYVVMLSQAMELIDDITLLKMRANQLLDMIAATRNEP